MILIYYTVEVKTVFTSKRSETSRIFSSVLSLIGWLLVLSVLFIIFITLLLSLTLSVVFHRCYMLPRPGIASPLPPLCTVTASAASSPPTHTCSIRSTCRPPYHCQTARSPHRIRGLAPCSSVTQSSKWSSTVSR